jgi:hypothetical protein
MVPFAREEGGCASQMGGTGFGRRQRYRLPEADPVDAMLVTIFLHVYFFFGSDTARYSPQRKRMSAISISMDRPKRTKSDRFGHKNRSARWRSLTDGSKDLPVDPVILATFNYSFGNLLLCATDLVVWPALPT